jgi:hypothetical protein
MQLFGALGRNCEDALKSKLVWDNAPPAARLARAPCVDFSGVRDGNLIVLDEIGLA